MDAIEHQRIIRIICIGVEVVLTVALILAHVHCNLLFDGLDNAIVEPIVKKRHHWETLTCLPVIVNEEKLDFYTSHRVVNLLLRFTNNSPSLVDTLIELNTCLFFYGGPGRVLHQVFYA